MSKFPIWFMTVPGPVWPRAAPLTTSCRQAFETRKTLPISTGFEQ
ncbi:hypothetical protein [Hymenobacter sp.]